MKIQHWAIIFIIIILPFSIVARNTIQRKSALLREETRYNNIIDNATYDAVEQLIEIGYMVHDENFEGKNFPISKGVADATIDRFFNTLAVNFNMPVIKNNSGYSNAKEYFSQYIPAIVIVGYDGLYVYSFEENAGRYEYVLKPKIPYTYKINNNIIVNFTLDNYCRIYFNNLEFMYGFSDTYESGEAYTEGVHYLEGYIGGSIDENDFLVTSLASLGEPSVKQDYAINQLPIYTNNLTYMMHAIHESYNGSPTASYRNAMELVFKEFEAESLLAGLDYSNMNVDYKFDNSGSIINQNEISQFHYLRRDTIIKVIQDVLVHEFNEHNSIAKNLGIVYTFGLPDIPADQYNNTINDISVISFIQGMPMGYDMYYNNYSLGGARIVKAQMFYGMSEGSHRVYHKFYCDKIPRNGNGDPDVESGQIDAIFLNEEDAHKAGYWICSKCM